MSAIVHRMTAPTTSSRWYTVSFFGAIRSTKARSGQGAPSACPVNPRLTARLNHSSGTLGAENLHESH